ncbi:MAG TPA: methyltransferase domain-containing protein [Methanomassiliicoccales archaeon]|jgi:SAM-dependent methyltransferase
MNNEYVHGYSERESGRLQDQADTLEGLLHHDTRYPAGYRVLEAGCGVGAQTLILARNSPEAHFTCVDISEESVRQAKARVRSEGITNVDFMQADLFNLPFSPESFDGVFVCFVLEHLKEPEAALMALRTVLKQGGEITAIEGDHGSCFFHPHSDHAISAIRCLIMDQANTGGDANIGRRLFPLISSAMFNEVSVTPRMVYVDAARPSLVDGFTESTFIAMVAGIREKAIATGMIDQVEFDRGIADLERTTKQDGTFCYTFFKCTAKK